MPGIDLDVLGNVFRRQDEIRDRGRLAALDQMAVIFVGELFGKRQSAMILQRRHAKRSVAARAGQHHADGFLRPLFRQGDQEAVDRRPFSRRLLRRPDGKTVVLNRGDDVRRTQIDRAAFDLAAVARRRQFGAVQARQQAAQPAFVKRLTMLQNKNDRLFGVE
jgi:hypothetical protein